jgi:hypothetical protein
MLQKNPNIINNLSPELKQLYQTTATPTQTKGLNESDIRRIATRVIKESNRGYLMEAYTSPDGIIFKVKDENTFNSLITSPVKSGTQSYGDVTETSVKYLSPNLASLIWACYGLSGIKYNFTLETTMEETKKFIDRALSIGKTNINNLIGTSTLLGNDASAAYSALGSPQFTPYLTKQSKVPMPGTQPPKNYSDWQLFLKSYIVPYVGEKSGLIEAGPTTATPTKQPVSKP